MDQSFALQKKIKENAEELASYLKDLNSWTRDISNTDNELKKAKAGRKLPPIRNSDGKIVEEKVEPTVSETDQQFLHHKEIGNEHFKKGDYKSALDEYSKSLTFKEDSIIYANRAAALLKLQRFLEAELDATKAIALDSGNAKAIYRRGIARKELHNYDASIKDLERAISLQPNKDAEKELTIVKQLYEKSKVEEAKSSTKTPIQTTNSNKKRMVVTDVEETQPEVVEEFSTPAATKLAQSNTINPQPVKSAPITNSKLHQDQPKESPKGQKLDSTTPTSTNISAPLSEHPTETKSKSSKIENDTPIVIPQVRIEVPKEPPKTSYEFEKYFKELQKEDFYQYLKIIPANSYKTLFKASFTSEIFSAIIECIHSYFVKNNDEELAFEIMKNLTLIERFDMIVMFMEEKEKKIVDSIFNHLSSKFDASEVRKLKSKFE